MVVQINIQCETSLHILRCSEPGPVWFAVWLSLTYKWFSR